MAYRSRKHTYLKKDIDSLFLGVIFEDCYVSLTTLTAEDIANYKLSLIKKKNKKLKKVCNKSKNNNTLKYNKTSKSVKRSKDDKKSKDIKTFKDDKTSKDNTSIDDEPAKKKQKLDTNGIDVLKLVLSREGETHKFKSQFKSSLKPIKEIAFTTIPKEEPIEIDCEEPSTSDNYSAINVKQRIWVKDLKKMMDPDNYIRWLKIINYNGKPYHPKNGIKKLAVAKLPTIGPISGPISGPSSGPISGPISRPISGPISRPISRPISGPSSGPISGPSSRPISGPSSGPISGPSSGPMSGPISRPISGPISRPISGPISRPISGPSSGPISGPSSGPKVTGLKHAVNGKKYVKGHLIKIEKLYIKYFSKSVQDAIVVIANILNIISMSNKHHKARMDESFKKRSEAEKLKERCDANRLHEKHKQILETKLKKQFVDVVSSFETSEFDSAFQMLFLSILTVLRVLENPKFKRGSIFKNLVLLLWNSLRNSEYDNTKVFSMFRLKTFRPDCIDLISLIEDSRDIDSGVTDRMSLFFVSSVNSQEYFQPVIDAVAGDSNDDLGLLIDNAIFQFSINSKFKDPVASPTAQYSDDKIPATETIPSIINSDEIIQHWFLAKNPDGTYQQIPVINGNQTQTIGNTAIKQSILTSQPLNNFYQSFSSSLQNTTFEPSTSKVIPTNKCFVVASTISHSPLVQVTPSLTNIATSLPATTTTFMTFKPAVPNNISMVNRSEGGTILVGNKQYQLVKGPTGQMRAVINKTATFIKPPPIIMTKCYARNCTRSATIMCSSCTSVKYCSHNCQRLDWYDSHINVCDQLLKKKLRP